MTEKSNTQLVQRQYTLINIYFQTPFRREISFTLCALEVCHFPFPQP